MIKRISGILAVTVLCANAFASDGIDFSKTYDCEVEHTAYRIEDGQKIDEEGGKEKTALQFAVEESHVLVKELLGENFFMPAYAVPNPAACSRAFEAKNIELNMHAIITAFNTAGCEPYRVSGSYFIAGLYVNENAHVALAASESGELALFATETNFTGRGNLSVRNQSYVCKAR